MYDYDDRQMVEEDIDNVLPKKGEKSIINWNAQFDNYWNFELSVRIHLEANGWKDISFFSIDSDSFGPLVRGMKAIDPSGQKRLFSYG